jgi:hypothetical protein
MKKIYSFLFLLFNLSILNAQVNIAPQGTPSASTCNTGPCTTLNDLNLGTCGTQQMWITTTTPPNTNPGSEWLQFDFSSPRAIDHYDEEPRGEKQE